VYLFIDASPQWRGRELFASSFDLFTFADTVLFQHRLLRQISIGINLYSAFGKTCALLWQIFLDVGPRYGEIRSFCNSVRSICHDYGAERLVPAQPDFLIPFLRSLHVPIPTNARAQEFLFPFALSMPGWLHQIDGLIRFGLCSLIWFPFFLKVLKALLRFVREHVEDIAELLELHGYAGAAQVMRKLKPPSFANWRWKTLHDVCNALEAAVVTLRRYAHVLKDLVSKLSDGTQAKCIKAALEDIRWYTCFQFVNWYSAFLTRIMAWGGSCPCHQEEWEQHIYVDCIYKGRLLPYCWKFVCDRFREMLEECNAWTTEVFGGIHNDFLANDNDPLSYVYKRV
jgi:hypothetical protein